MERIVNLLLFVIIIRKRIIEVKDLTNMDLYLRNI
jgi:hypothetical protein